MSKTHIQLELERAPLEVLLRYVEGKLNAPERKTVETLVADSPVYTDALEGLQNMENPALARSMTNDLRFRTRSLLRRKAKPRVAQFNLNQYLTAAVAALVVLFAAASVVYFYSRNDVKPATVIASNDNNQNQNAAPASEEDEKRLRPFRRTTPTEYDGPSLTEEIIADASPEAEEYSLLDEVAGSNDDQLRDSNQPTRAIKQTSPKPIRPEPETVYVALQNEPTLSEGRQAEFENAPSKDSLITVADVSEEKAKDTQESTVPAGAQTLNEVVVTKSRANADPVDPAKAYEQRQARKESLMTKGEQLFNTSRYTEAEKVFLELYTIDQLDPQTQYYLGSTYFYLGRPAEATIYLEQVIRVSSDYLEEAQWRLADAYLAVNKIKEAQKLLKKVSKQNGKYSDRAQAKLKELK